MRNRLRMMILCIVSVDAAMAQTVTTSGGTTNIIPKFSGSTSLVNSAITESNGNVGIGMAGPQERLHLLDQNGIVAGTTNDAAFGSSNAVIQSSYAARTPGTGSALSFAFPANTDGSNPWEQARIVGAPDNNNNGDAHGRMYLQTRTYNGGWVWNNNLLLTSDGSVTLGGSLKLSNGGAAISFSDGSTQATAFNPAGISSPINVIVGSGTSENNIAKFTNGTNGAYTSMTGAGNSSHVPTWSDGSQILEFVPYGTGNGIVSSYTGNLLFQTNGRVNQMAILANGNVGIGTTTPGAKLDVAGNIKLSGGGASISFPDGTTQSTAWNGTLCGGDYAESVDVSGDRKKYEPGDVLVIDPGSEGKFLKSTEPYSTSVMGIYSTKPGLIGRRQGTAKSLDEVPMAMMGIVPTKVSAENGAIHPGDLLVTSSTSGYAMKATDRNRMIGALIGKALGTLESGAGVIEVGVTLQ